MFLTIFSKTIFSKTIFSKTIVSKTIVSRTTNLKIILIVRRRVPHFSRVLCARKPALSLSKGGDFRQSAAGGDLARRFLILPAVPADITNGEAFPTGALMDFDEAVTLHSKWKRKLRASLAKHDGSMRVAEVSLDHKCVLGKWIYSEGASHSELPEYTKLKYEHARFHMVAAELLKRANTGESVDREMAACADSEFSKSSAAVVIAIMAIKARLSS
jgi:hypothetical protein